MHDSSHRDRFIQLAIRFVQRHGLPVWDFLRIGYHLPQTHRRLGHIEDAPLVITAAATGETSDDYLLEFLCNNLPRGAGKNPELEKTAMVTTCEQVQTFITRVPCKTHVACAWCYTH